MHLARGLGFRYLWVDALCLLQDDADERRRLIHGMDGIYGGATCTIICAAGTNADSRLSGVWSTARQRLPYDEPVRLSGHRLKTFSVMISRPSLDSEIRRSRWNTRGWTYQEMCLSSRSLFFTAGEVFFSCCFCHHRAGYELRDEPTLMSQIMAKTSPVWKAKPDSAMSSFTGLIQFHSLPSDPVFVNFAVYRTVVKNYTNRELTLSSDVINAFQGIFNRFIEPGKTHLTLVHEAQCIPPRFFHLALLWYPVYDSPRGCSSSQTTAPSKFSSWSWISWHGPVSFLPANAALGPVTMWNNDLAFQLPDDLGCLIQSSVLPRSMLSPSALEISEMAAEQMLSPSSPDTRQLPAEFDQSREPPRPPLGIGVLELWLPALLASDVLLSSSSVSGLWRLNFGFDKREPSPNRDDGWFRFDQDLETPMSLHSYFAIAVSLTGRVGVIGVAQNGDNETFRRVGVGWADLYWDNADYQDTIMSNAWTLKRVLLH